MSASEIADQTLTLRRMDSIPSASRVRHVDELEERALERFCRLVRSGAAAAPVADGEFVDGEIIVFTEYYRVDLS